MMGKSAISYIFKRKEQAVTLATKSSIRVEGERVQVDPRVSSFVVRPDIKSTLLLDWVTANLFFRFFFLLVTRNEENKILNCPKSVRRSEMS